MMIIINTVMARNVSITILIIIATLMARIIRIATRITNMIITTIIQHTCHIITVIN